MPRLLRASLGYKRADMREPECGYDGAWGSR
jgi:hypothetical protein